MATEAVFERVHYRHDLRWFLRLSLQGSQGSEMESAGVLCLACVIEMMEDGSVSVVRKKHMLSCFHNAMLRYTATVTALLLQDGRICAHFIGTLIGMLHSVEDGSALDLIIDVLVHLIVELKTEQFVHCVLDECHKQLSEVGSMRGSLPIFTYLGKLVDTIPALADTLVMEHTNLMEHLMPGLMYPNEGMKAAVYYLYGKLFSSRSTAEKLSMHFTEQLCGLFLATLENAQSRELQINCLGFLKQLLNYDNFVSVIMNTFRQEVDAENKELLQAVNPLPLVLKKLLLSRDEILQIASAQCMAAVLVHCPAKYAPAFIHADIPEFLFDQLSCTSEVLIWSLYCCLLLLTEEKLFFSKCHTMYGIEPVVRSLKEVLLLNNVELHKQGFMLFSEILKKQPLEIKLFGAPGIYRNAIGVLQEAVSCPVLEVAAEGVKAISAFLRKQHLSIPVQYVALQKLIEAVMNRCSDLSLPSMNRRSMGHAANRDQSKSISRQGQFLVSALDSFHSACRLAVECQSDPSAQENAFTAPGSQNMNNTLETFSEFLLKICDDLCIPIVMKHYERTPSPAMMEVFFSILSSLFTVVPSMRKKFAMKLAFASFIRLTLEVKFLFCAGQSNLLLNRACSDFLCNMCSEVWLSVARTGESQHGLTEMSALLQRGVPYLNCSIPESLVLLSESPNILSDIAVRDQQYSLVLILCLMFLLEDRPEDAASPVTQLLPPARYAGDARICRGFLNQCFVRFSILPRQFPTDSVKEAYILSLLDGKALVWASPLWERNDSSLDDLQQFITNFRQAFDEPARQASATLIPEMDLFYALNAFLQSVQDNGDCPATEVLRALLFLLAICQDKCDDLDMASLNTVKRMLENVSDLGLIYIHDARFLKFFLHYLQLTDRFGRQILEFWISCEDYHQPEEKDLICSGTVDVAHKVLVVLEAFLKENKNFLFSDLFRSRFLQTLQRLLIENSSAALQENKNLPLALRLLSLVQLRNTVGRELDSTDLKLLYQVSSLTGKCKPLNTEILQPSFNFLYCSLHQTTPCSQKRAVAMLLSSVPLMELLQKVLELTRVKASSSSTSCRLLSQALLCSAWLLTSSLLHCQHNYGSEVHKAVSVDLDEILNIISFRKKNSSFLLLVSLLQFLRSTLRMNFSSNLVTIVQSEMRNKPLTEHDAALYPLDTQRVLSLVAGLQNLLVQRESLLSEAVTGCLETLLDYLHIRNKDMALHVASQPWNRFVLLTLLNSSGESCFLQPPVLRLMTLVSNQKV
ncbi:meiosis inhibitor protein 1 [Rhinatrema bivittatum]|uniref:meiosis inhibitor protein 1 n=1 Tax=Rhinatrema bivittatum TaxID=194408 RepID=UPI001129E7CE|nr:meiosis inhibitor protein 1 [Rhinatrema bivittatum]